VQFGALCCSSDHGAARWRAAGNGNWPPGHIYRGDLSAAKHALTKEFYYNTRYDPVADILIDISPPALKSGTPPEPYKNPDPAVQAAHEAYLAALAAARPPEPVRSRPQTPEQEKSGRFSQGACTLVG
jgi:hypothetical protein